MNKFDESLHPPFNCSCRSTPTRATLQMHEANVNRKVFITLVEAKHQFGGEHCNMVFYKVEHIAQVFCMGKVLWYLDHQFEEFFWYKICLLWNAMCATTTLQHYNVLQLVIFGVCMDDTLYHYFNGSTINVDTMFL